MAPTPKLGDLIDAIDNLHPDGDALQKLSDAMYMAQHLGELADHLIGHFVDRARHSGASWTEIGQNMGVTKQAVQKRFNPKADTVDVSQFARFSPRARAATVASQAEARRLQHASIEPGHIVLAMLKDPDSVATKIIVSLAGSADALRDSVTEKLGPPAGELAGDHIPFSGASKKVLELTVREALRLGHNYIGTEHMLLGVLGLEDGTLPGITAEAVTASLPAPQEG